MRLVRDSGRVLNGAPQFVGRPEGDPQWHGRRLPGAADQKVGIFSLPGFVEDRGQICVARRASFFICATQEREESTENFQANGFEEYRQVLAEGVSVLDHWKWWYCHCRREETRRRRNNGDLGFVWFCSCMDIFWMHIAGFAVADLWCSHAKEGKG